jgi:hypothetical protein
VSVAEEFQRRATPLDVHVLVTAFLLVEYMALALFSRFAPVPTLLLRLSVAAAAVGSASMLGTTARPLRPMSPASHLAQMESI